MNFASVDDVIAMYRPLTASEEEKVETLIPIASDLIRQEAILVGKNIEQMLEDGVLLQNTLKSVTIDIIKRMLVQTDESINMTQMSQAALGYSVSGTFVSQAGGMYLLQNEKKRLGLTRQHLGIIEL